MIKELAGTGAAPGLYVAVIFTSEDGMVKVAAGLLTAAITADPEETTHLSNDFPAGAVLAVRLTIVSGR